MLCEAVATFYVWEEREKQSPVPHLGICEYADSALTVLLFSSYISFLGIKMLFKAVERHCFKNKSRFFSIDSRRDYKVAAGALPAD